LFFVRLDIVYIPLRFQITAKAVRACYFSLGFAGLLAFALRNFSKR
jgi:hypothetical protein